jgi:hypothetical protein
MPHFTSVQTVGPLTTWSRVIRDKLTGPELVKKWVHFSIILITGLSLAVMKAEGYEYQRVLRILSVFAYS